MSRQSDDWFGYVPDDESDESDARTFEVPHGGEATAEQAQASIAAMHQGEKDSTAWVEYLESIAGEKALKSATLVEYRAKHQRGDLLGRVIRTPGGELILLRPKFTLPPEQQVATHPDARRARTVDGEKRWMRHAVLIPTARWETVTLRSSHYSHKVTVGRLRDDAAARPARPVIL